jgi:hypothetical protein
MSSTGERQRNPAGRVMATVGGILGMAAVAAWLIGFKVTLSPSLEEAEIYKGLLASSFSLIVLGAIIGRRINREEQARDERLLNESAPGFEEIRERKEENRTT